jgi:hypothetical protein
MDVYLLILPTAIIQFIFPALRLALTKDSLRCSEGSVVSEHLRLSFVNANLKAGNMNCIIAVGRISSL